MLTDNEIFELVNVEKNISIAPSRDFKEQYGYKRNKFSLTSKNHDFSAYTRQSVTLSDEFSIGLIYYPKNHDSITILRYNGIHGEHINPDKTRFTKKCHIHVATQECINNYRRPEKFASLTDKYLTFEEAFKCFWEDINIKDSIKKYFSMYQDIQMDLFKNND